MNILSAAGDLLSLTDGKDQITRWNYDEYGRVTNKLDQASTEILKYKYDANNRLTNRWSTAKGDTKYTYDNVGNLTVVDYPSGTTDLSFAYDALNRVTNMVDAAGTTKYTYQAGGQLLTEDGPWASDTVTNTYSNRLRTRLSLAQPIGAWTNVFAYDAIRRLTNVTSRAGMFGYQYRPSRPSTLISQLSLPNSSYITNDYDNVARLTATHLRNSSHVLTNKHEYIYNVGNQRTQQVFVVGSTYHYLYDSIGQLKVADSATASEDRGYLYDAAWNLNKRTNNTTVGTFTVDSKNQLTASPSGSCKYDGNGNLTTNYPAYTATYDAENQLATIEQANSVRSVFTYDGRGRLRQRQDYTWYGSPYFQFFLSATVRYVYDGMRVIQERNDSNTPTVSYTRGTDLSGSLEGAGGIGGLLGRSHSYSGGNWGAHNFYHADGNGNVTFMNNSSQAMVARYRYDPFGNTISSSGSLAAANTYRFSSKEVEVNTGLYYYGYRWYAPNLQRWLNRDPLGEPGFEKLRISKRIYSHVHPNMFTFVLNNPVSELDTLGLKLWKCTRNTDIPILGRGGVQHVYLWDDKNNKSCGRGGRNPVTGEGVNNPGDQGPKSGHECEPIDNSDGKESDVINCCMETKTRPFPKNDCHDWLDECLKNNGLDNPDIYGRWKAPGAGPIRRHAKDIERELEN